jgi:hypothetical protein
LTIPPDTRAAGQTGHLGDHNSISDVLSAMSTQLGSTPSFAWGSANLAAGTVTVNNSQVLATSIVFIARMSPGGTLGHLAVPTIVAGVSFTVTSSSATETSQIGYLIKI